MVKLKRAVETGVDDVQTISSDIVELFSKFVLPIDNIRSLSKPPAISSTTRIPSSTEPLADFVTRLNRAGLEINTSRPLESRTNAFLRMMGFPIMATDGSFYSPGFVPNMARTLDRREKVNNSIIGNQNLLNLLIQREMHVQTARDIFVAQDANATAYALALRHVRSFVSFFDANKDPLDPGPQTFLVDDRKIELANFLDSSGQPIKNKFSQSRHILRPFIVNPLISDTVVPSKNAICAPFLPNKDATMFSPGVNLLRPGIEFILRIRLQQGIGEDKAFLKEVNRIMSGENVGDDLSVQDIRSTILALSGKDSIAAVNEREFLSIVANFSTAQVKTVTTLVKTIRVVLQQLHKYTLELDMIKADINWEPIPNKEGPEYGGSIRTVGGGIKSSAIDQQIGLLKILELNSQRQQKLISERLGGGNELFAVSVITDTQRNYSEEIARLTRERDEKGSLAINHMANIERISGEVSGLGLIDVLAIYTALWAIDIETLLGFLDDDAFNRLYQFNPELRTREVEERRSGKRKNGLEVLRSFEKQLYYILSFAQSLFSNLSKSPLESTGGDLV